MNCQIKKVPLVFKRTHPKTNYEFFVALVELITDSTDVNELNERMYILFSHKIKYTGVLFDYGWGSKGLLIWFALKDNVVLFVECDTEEILNDL